MVGAVRISRGRNAKTAFVIVDAQSVKNTDRGPSIERKILYAKPWSLLKVLAGQGAEIDTTTASGKPIFGIFAALAEFERELVRERTKAGLAAARARGRKGGRRFDLTKTQVRLAQAAMI